jgi:hypothetical protein
MISIMLCSRIKALLITFIFELTSFVDPHHFTNEWLTALLPLHLISNEGIIQSIQVRPALCQDVYSNITMYNAKSKSGKFKSSYSPAPMALRSIYTNVPGSTEVMEVLLVKFFNIRDSEEGRPTDIRTYCSRYVHTPLTTLSTTI